MKRNFRKIKSPKDLRRVLSDVINGLLSDEIDAQTAQAISSACNVMLKTLQVLKDSAIEDRLKRLEETLNPETGANPDTKLENPVTSDVRAMIRRVNDETSNLRG
jgi:hypothetical protein